MSSTPQVVRRRRTHRSPPPKSWPRRVLPGVLAVVILVLLGVWAVVAIGRALPAAADLEHGKKAADAARRETTPSGIESGPLIENLTLAGHDFAQAQHQLDALPVRALNWVPVLGRQIRSVRAMAAAGATVAATSVQAVTQIRTLAEVPSGGADRLDELRAFVAVAATAQAKIEHVSLGPTQGLIEPLATAHNQLLDELTKLRSGLDRGLPAARALVDTLTGHHQLLVLMANNAEIRAESGMPEEVGVLTVNDGRVTFSDRGTSSPYNAPGGVAAPAQFAHLWGWMGSTREFEDLLASPRFDVTGQMAAELWSAAGQTPVDGVILVDPLFLQEVLSVTGPLRGLGGEISAATVVPELLHNQYAQFPHGGAQTAQRKDELGSFAGQVFNRLDTGEFSLIHMAVGMATAARGRHVMLWSDSPGDEAEWAAAGAGGQLSVHSLGLSIENRGENKLDYFLTSSATLEVQPGAGFSRCTVTVYLHNGAVAGEPAEVGGPSAQAQGNLLPGQGPLQAGDYLGIVDWSLPAAATDISVSGDAAPRIHGPDGPTLVVGDQYQIRAGTDLTLSVTFRLPGDHGLLQIEPSARVPGTVWQVGPERLVSDESHSVGW